MKKIIYLFLSSLIFISCEENFAPKTDFVEKLSINCIVRGDSATHIATLLRSYDVESFNPLSNDSSTFIKGADIKIEHKGNIYVFRDTIIASQNKRYGDSINAYVVNFRPATFDSVKITANYNNKALTSSLKIPAAVFVENDPHSIGIGTLEELRLKWKQRDPGLLYYPRMTLYYKKRDDPAKQLQINVPVGFITKNGNEIPFYAQPTRGSTLTYTYDIIKWAIEQAVNNDLDRANYKIDRLSFELMLIDQFLSSYYTSANGYLDNLSIRLDEANYSNISGGFGIFGSYIVVRKTITFTSGFLVGVGITP